MYDSTRKLSDPNGDKVANWGGSTEHQACFAMTHKSSGKQNFFYQYNKHGSAPEQKRTIDKTRTYSQNNWTYYVNERASNFPNGHTWQDCIDQQELDPGKMKFYGFH